MNRQEEYRALIRELDRTPAALEGTALRARARARRRRAGKRWGISLGSVAGVCAAFVLAVNTLPAFALACGGVPVLRELAAAVAFSPSLSAAVEHDYVQYIGQSQSWNGVKLTLEYLIADERQMVVFYRVDGGSDPYYSAACDLKGLEGEPLFGYSVSSTASQEELRQFEILFKDLEEIPSDLTLDVKLWGTDLEGSNHPLDHVFSFQVTLDPDKTAPAVEVPVGQWVELDGQRLLVDRLELTPTRTTLCLAGDPANTAWLMDLDFHFTGGDGARYDSQDGSFTATGSAEHEGFYTYYFQSLYFVEDVSELTLWLDQAVWLDKEEEPVAVDLTDGSWTGALPEAVTGIAARRVNVGELGEQWVVTVRCTANQLPFDLEYHDPEGGTHNTRGYSMLDDREAPGKYAFEYFLEDYPWDTVILTPAYSSVSTPQTPVSVPLG